ncbi:6420_t:CDS:2 [Entrophospora sp. SA101]|nr:6420_t:CDS:2 [Entrophospora sp. SA101]
MIIDYEENLELDQSKRLFVFGWALKEFQKNQKPPIKRMSPKVKNLLEIMFHTGTVNPNQKMTADNMHEELLECVKNEELEEEEIPKISTIVNWITRTYACWKKQMAEETLDISHS